MSILIRYAPASVSREQYDKVNATLRENMPGGPPPALQLHVIFGEDGDLLVSEIWESEDAWREAWDGLLKPTLEEAGTTFEAEPEVFEAHALWGAGVPAPQPS